ncbi:unnamed protein product [Mytilus coruscus]|uniref:SMP-30/Gluconolactonase/LRE-like region domain-containing protein n=1 Tax=Mytilus coruscus TaxID=42192 RepID=A0A6J8CUM4_MYTCO|nr:unnamed protein product [Mytilus coruscus]
MDNLSQVTENILSQTEITLGNLNKSRNKIKRKVSEIKQKVIAHLDRLEADIHKDIDDKYENCSNTVSHKKENIQSRADSVFTWKNDMKLLKQHTSEIHLFQAVKLLDARNQKELEIREIQTETIPTLTYHSSESESDINKVLQDFGDGVNIFSGCFIPCNTLLLVPYYESRLYVCKLDGSKTKAILLDNGPEHIPLYDNNSAVVSVGENGIQIIDLTTLKPGRKIKVEGYCRGITSVQDKIWVNNRPNFLTILDINGKFLNTIQATFNPCDICANKNGDVYCTDFDSNKIYLVTSDGKEREIYNSPDLRNPSCGTVDERCDVYVAGYGSNSIDRLSNDGQKHDIVLTVDDQITRPTWVSYNYETRELLVVHKDDCATVNIYKT